ncbi:hypothetical protein [Thiococcus pfennigii]|uniref:hypothetical protein n=1 Tax=Thiococcus pfennigii TaxID=1057 RepID=UPI001907CC97|nr:hypothetical protein [Thiococcus pfennigii]MBK1699881.1 hypothetical protein [Thiococcus pfennigii]
MARHTGRLVLTPSDPRAAPDPVRLHDALTAVGLLGAPLGGPPGAYRVGPSFLALITFAGCAVHVDTEARDEGAGPFTHVRLGGPLAEAQLRVGHNTRPPRCPTCRERLADWRAALDPGQPLTCPGCATSAPACAWDWRAQAGCGRLFVDIEEVFPGEAVPTQALMGALEALGAGPWRHFYLQDP